MKKKSYKTLRYAVAYMRYSSNNQDKNSIEYQRRRIKKYCDYNNIKLVKEYVDMAQSGTTAKRTAFKEMIQDAKSCPVWDMVLVFEWSRFARNVDDALYYTNVLKDNDIETISITQETDDSPMGEFMKNINHAVDQLESRNNSVRTHAGMSEKALEASHCGGIPPLGYDLDGDLHLVVNEEEAELVKKIFELYENDYSYKRMAKILNAEGYRTKVNKKFTKNSFISILRQEKYTGLYFWNKTRQKKSDGSRNSHQQKPLDEQIFVEGGCPQIIPPEQFERVQQKLSSRARGSASSKRRHHYMLSGLKLLKCANCGEYMIGTVRKSRGKTYVTYYCPTHKEKGKAFCDTKEINAEYLDRMVAGILTNDLYTRKDVQKINDGLKYDDIGKKLLNKKLGVEKAMANVMKNMEYRASELLAAKLEELSQEADAIEKQLKEYKKAGNAITLNNKKDICNRFGKYLTASDDLEVKLYLKESIKEIVVANDDVQIKLNVA